MADEYKKVMVLFEQIRSDIKVIAEGHAVLDRKIDNYDEKLSRKIDDLTLMVMGISNDPKKHIRQSAPPAHVGV